MSSIIGSSLLIFAIITFYSDFLNKPNVSARILPTINGTSIELTNTKEYLYANLRPNTARLALKYGRKYFYVLDSMDIKDLLILAPVNKR